MVWRTGRSRLREKKEAIATLYTAPPPQSVVICLDELGPESAKSYPGRRLVSTDRSPAQRAHQEIDYGRRGQPVYVFGALKPATGEVFTTTYPARTVLNWVTFLEAVEAWIPQDVARIYAVLDNLNVHRAWDVLLFSLAHPRWEFVFQPKYASYLNVIEPWWKILRSLAFKGQRFAGREQMVTSVALATDYWNAHCHPFIWGRRRRHRSHRQFGIASLPLVL